MATFSNSIAAGANSGEIPVTANGIVSVNTDQPVVVEAKNEAAGGPTWVPVLRLGLSDSKAFVATSDRLRVVNQGASAARVEVHA